MKRRSTLILLAVIFTCLWVPADPVRAATHHVDAANPSPDDGSTWKKAFSSLQDALRAAGSGDTILVAAGVYYPDEGTGQTDNDVASTFLIREDLEILGGYPEGGGDRRDPKTNLCVLSGDLRQDDDDPERDGIIESPRDQQVANAIHVVTVAGDRALLDGFTVTAGAASGAGTGNHGGGLYAEGFRFTVRQCAFIGNGCLGRGGAVHLSRASGEFVCCYFKGNESRARGGALATLDADVSLVNCVALGNLAERGGAFNFNDGNAGIINGSISGNCGTINGGGIQAASDASLTICNTIIWNNCAGASTSAAGSSINLISGAKADRTDSIVENSGGIDPDFVLEPDPSQAPQVAGDLDLNNGSPAIDMGDRSKNSEPLDILCRARVNGDGLDIGAYEHVERGDFYVDASATGANDGSSWADAFPTLQGALAVAGEGDVIFIAEGVYYPDEGPGTTPNSPDSTFLMDDGRVLRGGYPAGGGTRNIAAHPTILSGDVDENDVNLDGNFIAEDLDELLGTNAYHVVTLHMVTVPVILSGLTITAGVADNGTNQSGFDFGSPNIGGGILAYEATARIEECRIISNRAYHHGGGAYLRGSSFEVVDCEFVRNRTTGGINPGGGALYTRMDGPLRIEGCQFSENEGGSGAACAEIANEGVGTGTCEIVDCRFVENAAGSGGEAAISFNSLESVLMLRCEIRGNGSSVANQSVIRLFRTLSAEFRECLIAGNRTERCVEAAGDTVLSVINTTIAANRADSVVLGSTAGGIPASSITIGNSVIVGNLATIGVTPRDSAVFTSHSLIDGFLPSGPGDLDGTAGLDPGFVDPVPWSLAPTLDGDYALLGISPLVDAGLDASTSSTLDLLGNGRFFDGDGDGSNTVDIGAYESQVTSVPPMIRITEVAMNRINGNLAVTVESDASGPYTAEWSRRLTASNWTDSTPGTLAIGSTTIVVPGSDYGWPAVDEVFVRVVSP